jgi:uncharacterized protein
MDRAERGSMAANKTDSEERFVVEVAYARAERQLVLRLEAHAGMRLDDVVRHSGMLERFPEIELESSQLGVFGKRRRSDDPARPGDRIEIYRPLIADPKESRRRRAARPERGGR